MDVKEQLDPELRQKIKEKYTVAVIPVGSIEQHGPHLPLSTDSDIVTKVARTLCDKNKFLLLPTINYGVSFEHAPFFNMSIHENTLQRLISDLCDSLYSNGIKTVFVLNGHHGNQKALKKLKTSGKKKFKIFVFSYWNFLDHEFDHAGLVESSLMLAICKKKVRMERAVKGLVTDDMPDYQRKRLGNLASKSFPSVTKNGVWGDPRKASVKEGIKMLAEIGKNLEKKCQTCLTGKNPKLHQ